MWFIKDPCGLVCVFFTYFTLLVADISFIRVGLWNEFDVAPRSAYAHAFAFQVIIALIVSSHIKSMFTQPGILPLNYDRLQLTKLPKEIAALLLTLDVQHDEEDIDFDQITSRKEFEEALRVQTRVFY